MSIPTPMYICVDVILCHIPDATILTTRRRNDPYKGMIAFPGGYVDPDETIEEAAYRELLEETSVRLPLGTLDLLGQWSRPDRDPRGRVVSLVFYSILTIKPKATAGDDAASVAWKSAYHLMQDEMAFDHFEMLKNFMWRKL